MKDLKSEILENYENIEQAKKEFEPKVDFM